MKRILTTCLIATCLFSNAQTTTTNTTEYVFVYFKDKPNKASFYSNPLSELTQKALDRRANLGIALDDRDAPLETTYLDDVKTTLGLTKIKDKSKWLNGVAVTINTAQKDLLLAKPYVLKIESFAKNNAIIAKVKQEKNNKFPEEFLVDEAESKNQKVTVTYNYGSSSTQTDISNIKPLHVANYTGKGIAIAILDSGFPKANTLNAFATIRNSGRIKDIYNFISDNTDVYNTALNSHGTNVFGIIGAYLNSSSYKYVGAAPDADFYLYATEDAYGNNGNDYPAEEMNFIQGLERADKMGVDIATASLGYQAFGDSRYNYTYADMNGTKSFVARGANIAVEKGIMVLNASGNNGASTIYKYINTPSDSDKVISIGAVDKNKVVSTFTSYGPNALGQIRPDGAAQGTAVYYPNQSGTISYGNGTSYATPIAAGGLACILQGISKKTPRSVIKNALIQKASLYPSYDKNNRLGYGIINFNNAFTLLKASYTAKATPKNEVSDIIISSNIVKDQLTISTNSKNVTTEVFDMNGRKVISGNKVINTANLPKGIYILNVTTETGTKTEKFIKE